MIKIGFSTTDKLLSRIIRWFTRSSVSHTWLLFEMEGIPMVLEATFEGVRLIPYETFQKKVTVVDVVPLPYSMDSVKFLLMDLGLSYDVGGLLGNFFVQIGRMLKMRWRNPWNNSKAMFCSELLSGWLKLQGYPGTEDMVPAEVSPEDLLDLVKPS